MSADINLDNIHATVDLAGGVDIGLDEIRVKELATINTSSTIAAGLNDLRLREVAPISVAAGLDDLRIREIAPINTSSKIDAGLDNIRVAELAPIRLELGVRPVRVHLPLSFTFCIDLFGVRLFKLAICGEGMAVAEDYKPYASEGCGE